MENLTVVDLKQELRKRGMDSSGTKAILLARLRPVVEKETMSKKYDEECQTTNADSVVRPEDSVSQISRGRSEAKRSCSSFVSSRSSVRVTRAMEAARRAGLEAKRAVLKEKHKKDEAALSIQHEKELLEAEADIEEARARELVLEEYESRKNGSEIRQSRNVCEDRRERNEKKDRSDSKLSL